jgi:hypothetical protein
MNDRSRGRRIFTEEERAGLVSDFRSSGISQRQFAQKNGLKLTTFQSWLYGQRGRSKWPRRAVFKEIKLFPGAVPKNSIGWAAEIEWPHGMTVRISAGIDPGWLGSVLQQLGRPC